MAEKLFDEKTLRKFEQLTLIASQVRAGAIKGERRSVKRGTSIEFADYRNYVQGDDLRRIDWNIYARLERPFIKLLEEEEDLAVHLIVDASDSMQWPRDPAARQDEHKFTYARRLQAGLAYISLTSGDRLSVAALADRGPQQWGPARGRARALHMLDAINHFTPSGETDLNVALKSYALKAGRAGLVIVISDMFSASGYREGLNALQGRGHEVALIHVLSPDEVNPPLAGDLRLVDVETVTGQDVTVDAAMRDLYLRRLLAWREDMAADCAGRGVHYVTVETSTPWEEVILYQLRRLGVVR